MIDNIRDWDIKDNRKHEYDLGQYKKIYRSTEMFVDWIDGKILGSKRILDMCCGGGANLRYLAERFPNIEFRGVDIVKSNIELAEKMLNSYDNVSVNVDDLYNLNLQDYKDKYSGVIMLQTLSWLPDYKDAMQAIANINPDWIALTSLFYEGNVEYKVEVTDYTRVDDKHNCLNCYSNIYSIPRFKEFLKGLGYTKFSYVKFDIDIDIERQVEDGIGTYTRKMEDGSRIQISAGMMFPWYFVLAER